MYIVFSFLKLPNCVSVLLCPVATVAPVVADSRLHTAVECDHFDGDSKIDFYNNVPACYFIIEIIQFSSKPECKHLCRNDIK